MTMNILYITGCTSVFKSSEDLKLKWRLEWPSDIATHTAHAYIHNTLKLASIILSIIREFYQQCWHSIIGQRVSKFANAYMSL